MAVLHFARSGVCSSVSFICHELDQPRTAEEEEKSEDLNENEKDTTEKRKTRGEFFLLVLLHTTVIDLFIAL